MRGMMQSDHPFTLLHFYHLLDTPEFQEKLAESIEDPAVKANMENLVEMNQDKFDPVLSRLQEWVENPQARRIVAQQESSFSMREIIEEDKILIVNAKVSESVRKPPHHCVPPEYLECNQQPIWWWGIRPVLPIPRRIQRHCLNGSKNTGHALEGPSEATLRHYL